MKFGIFEGVTKHYYLCNSVKGVHNGILCHSIARNFSWLWIWVELIDFISVIQIFSIVEVLELLIIPLWIYQKFPTCLCVMLFVIIEMLRTVVKAILHRDGWGNVQTSESVLWAFKCYNWHQEIRYHAPQLSIISLTLCLLHRALCNV